MEKKNTKHHGSKKRPNRMEILFNDEEFAKVYKLTKQAGFNKPTKFLREFLLHKGKVKAALTPEERKSITNLGQIGTNIWNIRKELMKHGTNKTVLSKLENMIKEFAKIRDYFKKIVQK